MNFRDFVLGAFGVFVALCGTFAGWIIVDFVNTLMNGKRKKK